MVMDFAAKYGAALFPKIGYPDRCTISAPPTQTRQPGGGFTPNGSGNYTPVYENKPCRLDINLQPSEQPVNDKETSIVRYKLRLQSSLVILDSYRITVTRADGRVTNLFVNATPQPSYDEEQTVDVTEF